MASFNGVEISLPNTDIPLAELNKPYQYVDVREEEVIDTSLLDPHKVGNAYDFGDVYEEQPTASAAEWEIDTSKSKMPYLHHIKAISGGWPHLRYLADWMQVSTTPVRWKSINPSVREERASRTKVAIIGFHLGKEVELKRANNTAELSNILKDQDVCESGRLFIVEDLSRDVIELLGAEFDIDPLFFRGHISDYMWYNTRDPWVELPDLKTVSRTRSFFSMRYFQARYFRSRNSFKRACIQSGFFNVLRRVEDDENQNPYFDLQGSMVGLVRSRASLWIRPKKSSETRFLGVLLVDPTVKEGYPLWGGYRNLDSSPSIKTEPPFKKPPRGSLLDDVIYWATTLSNDITVIQDNPSILAYRALQIICAEWLTITAYITTRLSQIEYELAKPSFRNDPSGIQSSLTKLHIWHHKVPINSAMLRSMQDTLSHDRFLVAKYSTNCMRSLKDDAERVYSEMGRLEQRIERIMALATAIASIEESRRAIQQNQNLERLTYLVVIFAPLAFVSSFFSMAADLGALKETFWVYFAVAAPLGIVVFLIVDFERLRRAVEGGRVWIRKRVANLVFRRTSSSAED